MSESKVAQFRSKKDQVKQRTRPYGGTSTDHLDVLDSKVTFRVNSELKQLFESVCSQNHSTISRELKRYMTECVRTHDLM